MSVKIKQSNVILISFSLIPVSMSNQNKLLTSFECIEIPQFYVNKVLLGLKENHSYQGQGKPR